MVDRQPPILFIPPIELELVLGFDSLVGVLTGLDLCNIHCFSFGIRNFVTSIIESVRTLARITPYPTGRLFGVGCPRHFVPGYDRTVPPDISQQALAKSEACHHQT
jgi:hypothetical protein